MGNPSVLSDEGREMPWSLACEPLNPASPAYFTIKKFNIKNFMIKDKNILNNYSAFKGWQVSQFGQCKKHWAAYYKMEIDECRRMTENDSNNAASLQILEVGFGNGSFMGWAKSVGHQVYGLEIEEEQLATAKASGYLVDESLESLIKKHSLNQIDGIVAFDVFEHFSDEQLHNHLLGFTRILKPGGWILARFPNGDSPFGRRNQNGDITHKLTLGSMAVRQICSNTGYAVLSIKSQRMPVVNVGIYRSVVYGLSFMVSKILEFPIQVLLNSYYPGELKWFPLGPNLVVKISKPK